MKIFDNTKGQTKGTGIEGIGTIAISLLIAAVILGLGANILTSIKDTAEDNTAAFGNQSLTWGGNNTAVSFTNARVVTSSVVLYNNGTTINQGTNYTVTEGAITILNTTSTVNWVEAAINVSYNYRFGSAERNVTDQGIVGQVTMASFLPTIALVAIAAIIIGFVLVMFRRKQ